MWCKYSQKKSLRFIFLLMTKLKKLHALYNKMFTLIISFIKSKAYICLKKLNYASVYPKKGV